MSAELRTHGQCNGEGCAVCDFRGYTERPLTPIEEAVFAIDRQLNRGVEPSARGIPLSDWLAAHPAPEIPEEEKRYRAQSLEQAQSAPMPAGFDDWKTGGNQ